MSKNAEDKIAELQQIEQNLNSIAMQKQNLSMAVLELESAINELASTSEAYRIVGSIMIKKDKELLIEDLKSKKEITEIKLSSIEKQEEKIRQKAAAIQQEVLGELRGEK